MSEARPRPRPRPKPRAKASSNDAPESSAAATLSAAQIKDEDALFMRNTTRTSKAWRQLDQLDKAASTKPLRIADSDSDGPGGSPRKSRKRKSNEKDSAIPRWEQDKDILRFLSKEPDSGSDDEVEVVAYSPSKGKGIPRKRSRISRSRSRSRSITPPPALPSHQLQNARNVVRQALAGIPRPLSPTGSDIDESTDTIVLDPELASIAKAVQSKSKSQQRFDRAPSASFLDEELLPHASGTITVRVRWKPHPQNTAAKSQTWAFKMNRDATFHTLFDEVADSAQIRTEKLIVTYNDKRVFASSTPEALEMPLEADLAACDAVTFEHIRKKQTEVAPPVSVTDLNIPSYDESHHQLHPKVTAMLSRPSDDSDNESAASNAGTFKLIVRSRLTGDKEFTLTVRPTTKCGAIVKAFLKRAGLSDQYPTAGEASSVIPPAPTKKKKKGAALPAVKDPRLSIDGDSADNGTEIETFDLDDGDQVEVVGL